MAEGPMASRSFASLQVHHQEHQVNFVRFDKSSAYLDLNSVSLQPLLGLIKQFTVRRTNRQTLWTA